jgi:hypothetical protein
MAEKEGVQLGQTPKKSSATLLFCSKPVLQLLALE